MSGILPPPQNKGVITTAEAKDEGNSTNSEAARLGSDGYQGDGLSRLAASIFKHSYNTFTADA